MLLAGADSIEEITTSDADIFEYFTIDDNKRWRVEFLKCLLTDRDQGGLKDSDLEWMEWLCIDW